MLTGGGGYFVFETQVQDRQPASVLLLLRRVEHSLGKDPTQPVRTTVANQRPAMADKCGTLFTLLKFWSGND